MEIMVAMMKATIDLKVMYRKTLKTEYSWLRGKRKW